MSPVPDLPAGVANQTTNWSAVLGRLNPQTRLIGLVLLGTFFVLSILAYASDGTSRLVLNVSLSTGFLVCVGLIAWLYLARPWALGELRGEQAQIQRLAGQASGLLRDGGLGGDDARTAFFAGPSATPLEGEWKGRWFDGHGDARKVFEPSPGRPYPDDEIRLVASGPRMHGVAVDPSTRQTYWLDGRLSSSDWVSLHYWSVDKPGVRNLTGVLFLQVGADVEAHDARMTGWWRGRVGDGRIVTGDVEMRRIR